MAPIAKQATADVIETIELEPFQEMIGEISSINCDDSSVVVDCVRRYKIYLSSINLKNGRTGLLEGQKIAFLKLDDGRVVTRKTE